MFIVSGIGITPSRGHDRLQTLASSTRTEHYAMARFSLVNASEIGDLNRGCKSVRVVCLKTCNEANGHGPGRQNME